MTAEGIKPLPRQLDALECPAFELLFGGQKGGAKSFFLLLCWGPLIAAAQAIFEATGVEQVKCRVVIFRKNLGDLADLIVKSHEVFKSFDPGAEYNRNEKKWTFGSGATVEFRHLDGPDDHRSWHGQEIIGLGLDQVEDIPYDVYSFLVANVRTADIRYKPYLQVRCTANPGGKHGDWVKKYFIDPHPTGFKVLKTEITNADGQVRTTTRAFIPSALRDNPYLYDDGRYEAQLRASLPEHLVRMYLEGDWSVVEGAFFSSLIKPQTLFYNFREQFPEGIPSSWEIRFGMDWGSTAPAATVFGTKDNDGRLWIIGEHYKPGITGRTYGESLLQYWKRNRWSNERTWSHEEIYGLIDHQATGKYGSDGATPAAGISSWGWRIFPAHKDRYTGIEQICERMQPLADGFPSIRIAKDMCPNLARTLQNVRVNKHDAKDYDQDDEAHAVDALRFLMMDWPMQYARPSTQDQQLDEWERLFRAHQTKQQQKSDDFMSTGYE